MAELDENEREDLLYINCAKSVNTLEDDVRSGLLNYPRSLPAKYFYDEKGSNLFDLICDTPEYYPTRTETALLDEYSIEIIRQSNPQHILEFGSGSSRKTHYLLKACEELAIECKYFPFDVCEEMLHQVKEGLSHDYTWLDVLPMVGDFTAGLDFLYKPNGNCMYVFLGGSLGNFSIDEARVFIRNVRDCMNPGDSFLLGVDRVKKSDVLHAAYNDAQGITEQFNLNVLQVLNERLSADFEITNFHHEAVYNDDQQRIEMYLISNSDHIVYIKDMGEKLAFSKNERVLTEISHKYKKHEVELLLTDAGMSVIHHMEPENGYFSLVLAGPCSSPG